MKSFTWICLNQCPQTSIIMFACSWTHSWETVFIPVPWTRDQGLLQQNGKGGKSWNFSVLQKINQKEYNIIDRSRISHEIHGKCKSVLPFTFSEFFYFTFKENQILIHEHALLFLSGVDFSSSCCASYFIFSGLSQPNLCLLVSKCLFLFLYQIENASRGYVFLHYKDISTTVHAQGYFVLQLLVIIRLTVILIFWCCTRYHAAPFSWWCHADLGCKQEVANAYVTC